MPFRCRATLAAALVAAAPAMALAHPLDEVAGQAVLEFDSDVPGRYRLAVLLRADHVQQANRLMAADGAPTRDAGTFADAVRRAFAVEGCGIAPPSDSPGHAQVEDGGFLAVHAAVTCAGPLQALTLRRVSFRADRTRTTLFVVVRHQGKEVARALVPPVAESATFALDGSGGLDLHGIRKSAPAKDNIAGVVPAGPLPAADFPEPGSGSPLARLAPPPLDLLAAWSAQGALHIAFGADHLLFLLTLVLAGRRLRTLVLGVTAFSLGHLTSMTAALLAGWGPVPLLDVIIGATIALSAWRARHAGAAGQHPVRLALVAAAFGLVHGLGFGQGLAQLVRGLDTLLWPLIAFGAGLDVTQLAWVALTAAVWSGARNWWTRRPAGEKSWLRVHASAAYSLAVAGVVAGMLALR